MDYDELELLTPRQSLASLPFVWELCYSCLRASIGSSAAARTAG